MRRPRFKVEDAGGARIRVAGADAHHALRVLRLQIGAEIVLFDGRGREVTARISLLAKDAFDAEVFGEARLAATSKARLILAVAPPKGSRADWLVEKCAELDVSAVWWLETTRGVVNPGAGRQDRWRRKAIAAAKQAGRADVMAIEPPRAIAEAKPPKDTSVVFYGEPISNPAAAECAPALIDALTKLNAEAAEEILVFIGPEGGFTEEERNAIERLGGRPVRLGETVLRVETAAVAAAAVWACWAGGSEHPSP